MINLNFVAFTLHLFLSRSVISLVHFHSNWRLQQQCQRHSVRSPMLFLNGGFGYKESNSEENNENQSVMKKSYDSDALSPIKDLIDEESGMREFFNSNEEWQPLFRSIASHSFVPAMSFMESNVIREFDFNEETTPWKRLSAIPTNEDDRAVLGKFLDAMQKSLIDIPVDETTEEDDNDLQFIEEGRRMLACSRFHVVQGMEQGFIERFDTLFATCWSEITELRQLNQINTGSLIVVPGFNYNDLRRFADMNLQRPLQWLGIHNDFEVTSLQQGGLGVVRLIHKL